MKLDLSDFTSIRQFANEYKRRFNRVDTLINNAGVGFPRPKLDRQGHDLTFTTNHLGHFLLTVMLLDLILATRFSRVINITSHAHEFIKSEVNLDRAYKGEMTGLL